MENYDLEVHRLIKAPRQRVFDAFLDDQAKVMEAFAPDGPGGRMRVILHELEPRVGGTISYTMAPAHGPVGDHRVSGRFVEIVNGQRIARTETPAGPDGPSGPETTVTITFEDADGGTLVTLRHAGLPDPQWAAGAKHGWGSALANLAAAWEAAMAEA